MRSVSSFQEEDKVLTTRGEGVTVVFKLPVGKIETLVVQMEKKVSDSETEYLSLTRTWTGGFS